MIKAAIKEQISLTKIALISLIIVNFLFQDYTERFSLDKTRLLSEPWRVYTAFFVTSNEPSYFNISTWIALLLCVKQTEGNARGRAFANIAWQVVIKMTFILVFTWSLNITTLFDSLFASLQYQFILTFDPEIRLPYIGSLRNVLFALALSTLSSIYFKSTSLLLASLAGALSAHIPMTLTLEDAPLSRTLKNWLETAPCCMSRFFID